MNPGRILTPTGSYSESHNPTPLTAMGLAPTLGTLIAVVLNLAGMKIFTNSQNETIVSTLLFTLTLAALMDWAGKLILTESLPFIIQMAVSVIQFLVSEYFFEAMQENFLIPLERSSYKLATAVHSWASPHCSASSKGYLCDIAKIAKNLENSIPVMVGFVMLLAVLYLIQAPYASCLWHSKKRTWSPPRPPTPFPSATSLTDAQAQDVDEEVQEHVNILFPPGSADENAIAQAISRVKAALEAVKANK